MHFIIGQTDCLQKLPNAKIVLRFSSGFVLDVRRSFDGVYCFDKLFVFAFWCSIANEAQQRVG